MMQSWLRPACRCVLSVSVHHPSNENERLPMRDTEATHGGIGRRLSLFTSRSRDHNGEAAILTNVRLKVCSTPMHELSMLSLQPEKRLMLAVLTRAMEDFRTYAFVTTGRGRFLFMEAAAWFSSTATGAFDFEGICHATGLEPACVRKALRTWYDSASRSCCHGGTGDRCDGAGDALSESA
jgi:hypothetical protein